MLLSWEIGQKQGKAEKSQWVPSGAPGLHALLDYFGIIFRFDCTYTYTYTFYCSGN